MRFSRSTHLLMYLSLETLTSIIRTRLPILVELTDLVDSVIIFLSQATLLRWLIFLLGSRTVILTVLLFWIYFFLASICSTMAFPPLRNSDHVVVSVLILVLIGTVFVIIREMFHGRISLNSVLLLLLVNFVSGF